MIKSNVDAVGLEFWLQWQVAVCGAIFVVPSVVSVIFINKRVESEPLKSAELWLPCWTNLNPLFLLLYRAFAFAAMAFLLFQTVASFGFVVFYFYTQWSFALVMVYFALGTIVSARGCWNFSKKPFVQEGEKDKFLKKNSEDINSSESAATFNSREIKGSIKLRAHYNQVQAGVLENLMQITYQTCGGAVMLTDIVFWCILLPFMTGENFRVTLLIGCMHSLNAVFLLLDSAMNSLRFPWYRFAYFVLWSSVYVVFQWVLHACGFTWWPYPFLELSTPWAPLWYLSLALVHIPCYGLYALVIKAKGSTFSRLFPQAFVRVSAAKKET